MVSKGACGFSQHQATSVAAIDVVVDPTHLITLQTPLHEIESSLLIDTHRLTFPLMHHGAVH